MRQNQFVCIACDWVLQKYLGNLQSMKGRMMVKWNLRKSRIIFPQENEHVVYLFI